MLLIVVVDAYCLPGFDQAEEETGMRKQGDRLASLGGNPHPVHHRQFHHHHRHHLRHHHHHHVIILPHWVVILTLHIVNIE